MTKFVPKEILGDSTFVAVYDPESGDTGYVRMGDLVDKSETTVTSVPATGVGSGRLPITEAEVATLLAGVEVSEQQAEEVLARLGLQIVAEV